MFLHVPSFNVCLYLLSKDRKQGDNPGSEFHLWGLYISKKVLSTDTQYVCLYM